MKTIVSIAAEDWRRIGRNWTACVILGGLALLPSLYAWFNILASWDPYGRTSEIPFAVVNEDAGYRLSPALGAAAGGEAGGMLRAGDEIVKALRANPSIGWHFVGGKEALDGVRDGTYYASILIPPNFSERMASILSPKPLRAEITYTVNEKINAIAPKITSSGTNTIIKNFTEQFSETVNGTIFRLFNELGTELERERPAIEHAEQLVYRLEKELPELTRIAAVARKDLGKTAQLTAEAQKALPFAEKLTREGSRFADGAGTFLQHGSEALQAVSPAVKQNLLLVQQAAAALEAAAAELGEGGADNSARAAEALAAAAARIEAGRAAAGALAALLPRLGAYGDAGGVLAAAGKRLGGLERSLARQAELARAAGEALAAGRQPAAGLAEQLRQGAGEAGRIAADLLGRYDSELAPRVAAGVKAGQKAAAEAGDALKRAHAELPAVTGLLQDAAKGIAFGQSKLDAFQSRLPEAEKRIRDLAAKLRELRKKGNLGEAIELLKSNYVQKAEFLARPIELKQHSLFPIANYGTAMTPFFTVLSLWVGALLLVSMLSLDVHRDAAVQHAYLGRFLTFWAIGLLQSLLVTLGDILLLGVRPASPVLFVLSGLLISTVFMLIVYTLVSVLGNVGKAAAIVLLVLQLAGSGGTFPVQVTAPIFRAFYPFLPFTYAVGLMRETVGGILPEAAHRDLSMLLLFGVIALLAGLMLKKPLGRAAESLAAKARASGIIH